MGTSTATYAYTLTSGNEGSMEPIFTVMMRNYCQNRARSTHAYMDDHSENHSDRGQFTLRVYLSIRSIVILSFYLAKIYTHKHIHTYRGPET